MSQDQAESGAVTAEAAQAQVGAANVTAEAAQAQVGAASVTARATQAQVGPANVTAQATLAQVHPAIRTADGVERILELLERHFGAFRGGPFTPRGPEGTFSVKGTLRGGS
ncbi:hypothetical protein VE02_02149 [Pseudogymnoascus sp. 03VT05]|nr:hypothetical protein VE02_02149 [Pseudogymnoascus sp. 03VT05]